MIGSKDLSFSLSFLDFIKFDIRLIVMFLLAEPHFAMTIPLLYGYRKKFKEAAGTYLYFPLILILLACLLFFISPNIFFLFFLVANIYHVNRQSVGFLKLQAGATLILSKVYETTLHLVTIICLYFAMILENLSFLAPAIIFCVALSFVMLFSYYSEKVLPNTKKTLVFGQGILIFLPIALFEDILLAFAVGISIHYLQYLTISWKVLRHGFGYKVLPLLCILLAYTTASSGALGGFLTSERISVIVFIPTAIQLLHFYYDGLIWQRSDKDVAKIMKKAL